METYLQIDGLTKRFGDLLLFENISFSVMQDEKVALIAKNGTGKTTLLNIIAGLDTADEGKIIFKNNLNIAYLPQEPHLDPQKNVMDFVLEASGEVAETVREYEKALISGDQKALQEAMDKMDAVSAWDYEARISAVLTKLKITKTDKKISLLSGGEKKRVALANILVKEPDFLILDEPTNHLDIEIIEWIEEYLKKNRITLLMVTHDRYFLDRVCNRILELDDNTVYKYNGNYSYFLEKRKERIELQEIKNDKINNFLKKESEWIRRMPKARGTKAKYRIDKYYSLSGQIKNTDDKSFNIDFIGRRTGKKILDIKNLSKSFGDKKIIENFSYSFTFGEKIGIVGHNGTGKTTFLNLITGELPPDSGIIDVGQTIVFGYYKQTGLQFDENQRVIDIVTKIADVVKLGDGRQMSASAFLEYFLFPRPKQYVKVAKLSGGEKKRLYLLTVLMKNPNFLILDEPTNDLDIVTLNILEDFLQSFKGCVLTVSHDRYFMDKVVDSLFVFEGDGVVKSFVGKYTDFHTFKELNKPSQKKNTDKPKKSKPARKREKKGLTYKEKILFEQLTKEIEELENEKQEILNFLNGENIDYQEVTQKSKRLEEINNILDEKEMQWLELSEKIN